MENIIYIIAVFFGILILMQLYMRLTTFLKKGKPVEGVSGSLGRDISKYQKLLVYFYTNSCAACKPMTPVIDKLSKEFNNVRKVNLSQDLETARAFGVMGTPATVLVENKKIAKFDLGAKTESYLRSLLQE